MRGLDVIEEFGNVVDHVTNDWDRPTPRHDNAPDGRFVDEISIWGPVGYYTPTPVSDPLSSAATTRIRSIPQTFYGGTITRDVRVQTNVQVWYRGYGDHESITSPVPNPLP